MSNNKTMFNGNMEYIKSLSIDRIKNPAVYYCYKPENTQFYRCIKFRSFSEAYLFSDEHDELPDHGSAYLPVCRFMPSITHPFILNYKLAKAFIKAQIVDI